MCSPQSILCVWQEEPTCLTEAPSHLAHKEYTRLQVFETDKHTSLIYQIKKLYDIDQ